MSSKTYEKYTNWRAANKPYVLAAVAAIVVFIIVAPMVEKGHSMGSTIDDGDVMIIHKTTYSENRDRPGYEDVVAFKQDFYKGKERGEHRAGRVIGLSGDSIAIKDGDVYRNDKKLEHKSYEKGQIVDDMSAVEVAYGEVFILCDNREDSIDSRNPKVGTLKLKDIRGKVLVVIWPFSHLGTIN